MTIIVLWILLSLIALIVILLHFSVSAYLKVDENGFGIKVKYLFFTLYPRKPKRLKIKKIKKKEKVKNNDQFSDSLDKEFDDYREKLAYENLIDKTDNEEAVEETVLTEEKQPTVEEKLPDKKPEIKDKKLRKKPKKNKGKEKEEGKISSLKAQYNKYKPYFPMGWKYFKKLLKAIRITNVRINVDVGREDAHEAVVYYGAVQGALFSNLGLLCNIFTVKVKKANVNCVFAKNTINGSAECIVRVRPSTMIAIAFCIGINFLIIYFRQRRSNKKNQQNENINTEVFENE